MNKISQCLAFSVLLSLPLTAVAQDSKPASMPAAKDHEFNEKVPTQFTGKTANLKTQAGDEFMIYQSGPESAKKGILLIHEWWGLNAHIKGLADQLGKLGYRCYAIDLYSGKVATNAKQASQYMQSVDGKKAQAKLNCAIDDLAKNNRKIGTIGWCFGGGWSLKASIGKPNKVNATVIYYGRLVTEQKQLQKLKAPVLGIFAKKDGWIKVDQVKAFEKALNGAKVKNTIHIYDADHAFANPSGQRFERKAAKDAWAKTLAFFNKQLS